MTHGLIRPLGQIAWPHRVALAYSVLFMVAETAVSLSVPWFGGRVANSLLGRDPPSMQLILLLLAGLFGVQAFLQVASSYV